MKQILWFRRDLRLEDNAILAHAKGEVLPIFIFDPNILSSLPKDDKRVYFIFLTLQKLKQKLQNIGLDLFVFFDQPVNVFRKLKPFGFEKVLASCDFDEYAMARDNEIDAIIPLERYYDSWLVHPKDTLKKDGTPYKVFTPFYRSLSISFDSFLEPFEPSSKMKLFAYQTHSITLESLGFEPTQLPPFLEQEPLKILADFQAKIDNYALDRDFFYKDGTSNLSVCLRFGLISPKQILNEILKWKSLGHDIETFKKELFWREFYNMILYYFPYSQKENFNHANVAWRNNKSDFEAWCKGQTGIAIIDATMRCLNQTGTMPNRLRMVAASFLTKNLLIDWRWGEAYFAQKLLDYEASSNIGSWQWAASTGADAVPYFRVFNPETQSKKFDPKGEFISKYLTNDLLPKPIVDLKLSAKRAISAYQS